MRRLARPLLALGTVVGVLAMAKAHAVRHGYDFTGSSRFTWSLAYIALLALASYGAGLPDVVRNRRAAFSAAVGATAVAAIGISLVQLAAGSALLPRFVVFGTPSLLVPFYVACAAVALDGRAHDGQRDRVVAVTGLDEGLNLEDELGDHFDDGGRNHGHRRTGSGPERPAVLVRTISPAEAAGHGIGDQPLVDAVVASGATALVLDRAAQADESIVVQAARLHETGVRVRTLSLFYDEWLGKLPVAELERIALMFDIGELHRARYGRMKRMLDATAAAAGLLAMVVVTPLVLVGNRIANRGPLFYRQSRVGKNGTGFEILKFRTMRPDSPTAPTAGSSGGHEAGTTAPIASEWTATDDPRITPFGAWLRRSHLDELPQVVNILRGELSVVGPRPEQPQYVEELTGKIPFYSLRHLVRPGLTGWAQVKFPYGASEADAFEKLQYEFYYLRHQGLAIDLRIIGRTLRTVVGRGGR